MEPPWIGGMKVCSRHLGHMTKMAAISGNGGLIYTKLEMLHQGLQLIIVCSNDDPELTLTYFTARLNLVTLAFL